MLARRHSARAFRCGLLFCFTRQPAHMRGRGERRIGEARHAGWVCVDQRLLARIPGRKQFRIRQTTDQAGMNEACEIHAGDVA